MNLREHECEPLLSNLLCASSLTQYLIRSTCNQFPRPYIDFRREADCNTVLTSGTRATSAAAIVIDHEGKGRKEQYLHCVTKRGAQLRYRALHLQI